MATKGCGHTVPCGCGDSVLPGGVPCNDLGDCAGSACAEVFCSECVKYCSDDFKFDIGSPPSTFTVKKGLSVLDFYQGFLIFFNDPACQGTAALGVKTLSKGSTNIKIQWNPGVPTDQYRVHWTDGVTPQSQLIPIGVTLYDITGLLPATTYDIHVEHVSSGCNSVILMVETNA